MRTGWDWETVLDTITWKRYEALLAEWRAHPPVQDMVQAYLGIKGQGQVARSPEEQDPSGLLTMFPDGVIR